MNNITIELELLYSDAKKDPLLKENLLATRSADDPMDAFFFISFQKPLDILFCIYYNYQPRLLHVL
jgi:hypothetical protein